MDGHSPLITAILAADPESLAGDGLAQLHDGLREADIPCRDLANAFLQRLGLAADSASGRALIVIADRADHSGRRNAFHNPAHSREVAVNWWLLSRQRDPLLDRLGAEWRLLGLMAAFGHDLGHDGRGNRIDGRYIPFRLESVAAGIVGQDMLNAGLAEPCRNVVRALILATDVRHGHPQLSGGTRSDPRFDVLADDATLLAARMLRDADLMPSAATSIEAYRARTAELEREMGLAAGALSGAAGADFFDSVVEERLLSAPAQPFSARLAEIAQAAKQGD